DNTLSYELNNHGEYYKITPKKNEKRINSHTILEEYVSKIYKTLKKDTDQSKAKSLAIKLFKND
ncbi:hypothetical protein FSE90_08005, partial [Campylobacter novaezeelandiae]